jgi:hypothetical protein
MGKKIVCSRCKNSSFLVYENVYNKMIFPENHYEIVCENCRFGFVALNIQKERKESNN